MLRFTPIFTNKMFNSFNLFLLSKFSQRVKGGQDIQSLLKRYQILSIIYLNICGSTIILFWNIVDWLGYPLPCLTANLSVYPLVITSLYLLKQGHQSLAAMAVLAFFHLTILVLTKFANGALTGLCIAITCPACAFLITSSRKVQITNLILCFLQHFALMLDIQKDFNILYTEGQAAQIFQMQVASLLAVALVGTLSYISKAIETELWQLAQSNYERAEKINKEVMNAIEAKDNFASSLSHEIRNPLSAMKGSIDYLLRVVQNKEHLRVLEHAHLSSEVLLTLLNNVLDAAKLRSDKIELDFAETNLIDIIRKIVIIFSDRLREKEIRSRIMIDKTIPHILWIDSSRLLQIIINLFANSLKFTPFQGKIYLNVSWCTERSLLAPKELLTPIYDILNHQAAHHKSYSPDQSLHSPIENSKPILSKNASVSEFNLSEAQFRIDNLCQKTFETKSISQIVHNNIEMMKKFFICDIKETNSFDVQELIDAYALIPKPPKNDITNGFLKVQISDTGSGIAPEHLCNLFERFEQGGRNVSSVYGGSGLGLWITKQLCQKMGGDITVYTQLDKGTTFVLYIPVYNENMHNQTLQDQFERTLLLQEKKVRALVVDDYAYNRDIHKLLLEREGVQVSLASNGKESLEKYMKQPDGYYDLLMMDVHMPEMDGFTAVKAIREWEEKNRWRRVNIYIVSGEYYNESEIMNELRTHGGIESTLGIKCLRKPIDVEVITNIVQQNKLKQA